jgi:hypothetical protein
MSQVPGLGHVTSYFHSTPSVILSKTSVDNCKLQYIHEYTTRPRQIAHLPISAHLDLATNKMRGTTKTAQRNGTVRGEFFRFEVKFSHIHVSTLRTYLYWPTARTSTP